MTETQVRIMGPHHIQIVWSFSADLSEFNPVAVYAYGAWVSAWDVIFGRAHGPRFARLARWRLGLTILGRAANALLTAKIPATDRSFDGGVMR